MSQVTLESEKFGDLIRCLSILEPPVCNDVDIRNGIIRQRSCDSASIFEIDLVPLLGDLNLPLTQLDKKLKLLGIFNNQDVNIESDPEEGSLISDQYTQLRFYKTNLEWLDNKYMTRESFDSIFTMTDDDLILEADLSPSMCNRIKVVTANFQVESLQVIFDGEQASISAKTRSKDQSAKIMSGIIPEIDQRCSSSLVVTPFIIDHDANMKFQMYNVDDNLCINKYTTTISDIMVTIYGRSSLTPLE